MARFTGSKKSDTIIGFGGNDQITGGMGDDTLSGGDGLDTLSGGAGSDQLAGEAGNDWLNGGSGNDSLSGGGGLDFLSGGNGEDVLAGDAGNDRLGGGRGSDKLDGGTGSDQLDGNSGSDQLFGGEGSDLLIGNSGNDTLIGNSDEAPVVPVWTYDAPIDSVKASVGDIAEVSFDRPVARAAITFDFEGDMFMRVRITAYSGGTAVGVATLEGYDHEQITFNADFGEGKKFDSIKIEKIWEDHWTGNPAVEPFAAGLKIGTIKFVASEGGAGDKLYGGTGNDLLVGSQGKDHLYGDAGDDKFMGSAGADWVNGGAGFDTVDYSSSTTSIVLALAQLDSRGIGSAIVTTRTAPDQVVNPRLTEQMFDGQGGFTGDAAGDRVKSVEKVILTDGNDRLLSSAAGIVAVLGKGNDIFDTRADQMGKDVVYAGAGEDKVFTGGGDDTIYGGDGDDLLSGEGGDDSIDGGNNNDWIIGGDGDDILIGGKGYDMLRGGAGNDQLLGGDDDDRLEGGAGDDSMVGGQGNDWFTDEAGSDTMVGGAGDDGFTVYRGLGMAGEINNILGQGDGGTDALASNDRIYLYGNGQPMRFGIDWTFTLTKGTAGPLTNGKIHLSSDAEGSITFVDDVITTKFTGIDDIALWG